MQALLDFVLSSSSLIFHLSYLILLTTTVSLINNQTCSLSCSLYHIIVFSGMHPPISSIMMMGSVLFLSLTDVGCEGGRMMD